MHTIPVMKDGDVVLTESRAIISYLADKVGDRKLYPKDDVVAKAKVDQRLFFDMATFYKRLGDTMVGDKPLEILKVSKALIDSYLIQYPIMFPGTAVAPEKLDLLMEVIGWVEDLVK